MKHLYFVRHGESVMNKKGIFSGRTETPLTEKGKRQALAAAAALKGIPIDCIISSPMGRTIETAEILAASLGYPAQQIIRNGLFTERDFGPLEKTTFKPNLGNSAGVETVDAILARAQQGLDYIDSLPFNTILIVSHGAIGRALRQCIHPDILFLKSKGFSNGEVVKLR